VIDALRSRVHQALLYARALRSTGAVEAVRPARLAEFLRGARRTGPGLHLAVMLHAANHPDREALIEYGGDGVRRMTWGELDATINRLGNALAARGVAAGGRVALMLPNGAEFLIAHQALARLGAIAVQLGYRLKAGEIAHILDNAEPGATVVHADYLAAMTEARRQVGRTGPMIVVGDPPVAGPELTGWDRALAAASPEVPHRTAGDTGGAGMIVYTSGTTGKSKGAHRSIRASGLESVADLVLQVGLRGDDRHLVVCPLYHSMAPAFVAILMSLGATTILMNHFEPAGCLDIIARERASCAVMVPTMMTRILDLPPDQLAAADASSLRWVMSGAAPLPTETARRFMARFGPVLWNFYGSTETGMVTLAGPDDHLAHPGTIGRALTGNQIRLLDDAGREVPPGAVGELYARNSMLITGYHRNPEASGAALRDGMFSVGDLARRDAAGYYYLESRKHDMVISGGVNIYPREIEDHLATHPAILEAAVIGVPDPEWGEAVHAFVVVRAGRALTERDVIEFCRAGLADYKRPRRVAFVAELPRNPTGKVLKRELRDRARGLR
jgi:fatty-acyl-CoA synthase